MPKIRRLSGREIVRFLSTHGFDVVGRRGSHVKLNRVVDGARETLVVPDHPKLDTGTCRAIMRQVGRYVPQEQLWTFFYSD